MARILTIPHRIFWMCQLSRIKMPNVNPEFQQVSVLKCINIYVVIRICFLTNIIREIQCNLMLVSSPISAMGANSKPMRQL